MNQKDTAYVTMTSTTLQVLGNYETEWKDNKPFDRQVTAIRSGYTATQAAQQAGNTVSTGVTNDKEAAGDAAIEEAVLLAGYVQAYALEQENMTLYEQMRVSFSLLDRMPDESLTPRLNDLYQRMKDIGQPLEEYGIEPGELDTFKAAIEKFDSMKTQPRLTINTRKGHNDTLPATLRGIRAAFAILDKLIKKWNKKNPVFVREYESARNVIDRGGHSGSPETPPAKTDA